VILRVPFSVEQEWSSRSRVAVKGVPNGPPFRSSIFPMGDDTHCPMINKQMQAGAKAGAGDWVDVAV